LLEWLLKDKMGEQFFITFEKMVEYGIIYNKAVKIINETNDEKLKLKYQAEIDEVHLVLRYFLQSKVDQKFKNGIIDMLFKYAGYDHVSAESTNEILAKKENERIAGAYTIKFLISDMLYKIEKTH
jgi:hypothetical protein